MQMLLVKSIETITCDRETVVQEFIDDAKRGIMGPESLAKQQSFVTEVVNGRRYVTAKGQTVCIGMTRAVQEAIGLPCEAWTNQESEMESQRAEIRRLNYLVADLRKQRRELEHTMLVVRSLTLWQRLWVLFGADPATVANVEPPPYC